MSNSKMDNEKLDTIFYQFRHNYHRAEKVYKRLCKKGSAFSFNLEWDKEKGGKVSYDVPDEQTAKEFAVSMSRFLLPSSLFYINSLIGTFQKLSMDSDYQEFLNKAEQSFNKAKKGQFPLKINNKCISAEEIFVEISSNILFANDIDAIAYLNKLQKDPITGNLKWSLYYGYCLDTFNVLSVVIAYFEKHNIRPPKIKRKNYCIYCRTTEGNFNSIEHIVPESIGNETLFLPLGYMCDKCNNDMSKIEQAFVNSLPMNLLRVFSSNVGKEGKFPSVKFSNIHIQKTSPNSIKMVGQAGNKSIPKATKLADGGYKIDIPQIKQKIDHHMIARALFKMGLGIVAIDKGREGVLQTRYDMAREYVLNGGHFPNRLVLFKQVQPSNAGIINSVINEKEGTFVSFELLGARFIIGLEPNPKIELDEQLLNQALIFDLWVDKPGPHHGITKK